MEGCVLVRYGEIALKSDQTRKWWNKILLENMKDCLDKNNIEYSSINVVLGRFIVYTDETEKASIALKNVFGITSLSPAIKMEADFEKIKEKCLEISKNKGKKFRVSARRISKDFSMTSNEVNEVLGAYLKENLDLEVSLLDYDFEMGLEFLEGYTYLFTERIEAFGGLPIGVQGEAICLVSSGIDSPVAAWLLMKRGCKVDLMHFKITEEGYQKYLKIKEKLQKFSYGHEIKDYIIDGVPYLSNTKQKLCEKGKEKWVCIFCKRRFLQEAEKLCNEKGYLAIVTGENLGQVASQTLKNLTVLDSTVKIPVLRPVLTYDKNQIVEMARVINTYEISKEKEPKCPFTPNYPMTSGSIEELETIERMLWE
ncbi:MAG: thiamine biosynthesis protein ThiI [Candidatus Methanofastidiosum methylothiophilum]|uniref:Probable tRNA sulfurtransferase n=1 Tax=Candidatus Methanofastidiosum methylothiophilum TaxID=1705564 RepID=A0A150IV54_9EURY|nr:MAG: thiamine biosynthesis protein ThiI [Candidatus Methanofastidiosum methylthiophilus]KYC47401.1 MAG: thiamine biosynthesis protein ThiI [Candidatus Methanofastidiosum methylthiophilus]KYC48889.1 MAG: thiamine biosynthesis protein ThiI [Candidatus Methanofastidiosum methylthiophilus]